ncbi:VanZ family protein [Clostridium sp.]|uniref:VanZ family protein n=1 Tax=Clostridium sp. TaxID=1506 RepID=UPI0034249F2F
MPGIEFRQWLEEGDVIKKIVLIVLCITWMGFIFYNSSNNGNVSNKRSYNILDDLKRIKEGKSILPGETGKSSEQQSQNVKEKVSIKARIKEAFRIPQNRQERLNLILRKNAHAFEYLVLAIIVSGVLHVFKLRGKQAIVYIMFICLLYAVTDEFHQQLVPGRTSLVSDVVIDFAGSLIGILVFYVIYYKLKDLKNY